MTIICKIGVQIFTGRWLTSADGYRLTLPGSVSRSWDAEVFTYLKDKNVVYFTVPRYGGPTTFQWIFIPGVFRALSYQCTTL